MAEPIVSEGIPVGVVLGSVDAGAILQRLQQLAQIAVEGSEHAK